MCVGFPHFRDLVQPQWRPDNEFEMDTTERFSTSSPGADDRFIHKGTFILAKDGTLYFALTFIIRTDFLTTFRESA